MSHPILPKALLAVRPLRQCGAAARREQAARLCGPERTIRDTAIFVLKEKAWCCWANPTNSRTKVLLKPLTL
jgi:hypothetical protein